MTMEESTGLLISPILQKVLPIKERKGPGKRTNCLKTVACSQLLAIISFKGGASGEKSTCQCRRCEFDPWVGKIPWRRKLQPTPVFLPGKFHGQRSLQSMGSQRVGHDWPTHTHTYAYTYLKRSDVKLKLSQNISQIQFS